ncbi:hypothetical protein B0H63DRAFT_447209 [Podospora didyma]|uniref:Uncharacterized protein n=1 Tax=Podospora didyma TaxID=330526 RepID=A0AAE0P140_9PEZI|nr:hypothetical protein B0H63DRAFT_447209 [Podospora didyma]
MTSSTLLNAHNQAVKAHLDQGIEKAITEASTICRRTHEDANGKYSLTQTSKAFQTFFADMHSQLCSNLGIHHPRDNHKISRRLLPVAVETCAQGALTAYTAAAAKSGQPVMMAIAFSMQTDLYWNSKSIERDNSRELLAASAMMILILERAFWLGGARPNLDQLARAAVEGQSLEPKLVQFANSKQANVRSDMDYKALLTEVVSRHRLQPPRVYLDDKTVADGITGGGQGADSDLEDEGNVETEDPRHVEEPDGFLEDSREGMDLTVSAASDLETSEESEDEEFQQESDDDYYVETLVQEEGGDGQNNKPEGRGGFSCSFIWRLQQAGSASSTKSETLSLALDEDQCSYL